MTTILRPASDTIAQLNAYVQQFETAAGPLTAMSVQGAASKLVFDDAQDFPAKVAVIAEDGPAGPVVPPGSTVVCSGTIYDGGTQKKATATRPA